MTSSTAWINITWSGATGNHVAGPFSGQGAIQLFGAGFKLYPSQSAATSGTPQTIDATQIQTLENVILQGPGIGQGFFGLLPDLKQAGSDISGAVKAPLTGLAAIGDFFQRLTQPSTWIRVGEFVGGGLLLYIGGTALVRGTAAGNAAKSTSSGVLKLGKKLTK